jgi:hypothetical protein
MTYRIQPPGVFHEVYTPVKSIASGGHFLTYNTMHLTDIARVYDSSIYEHRPRHTFATNNVHDAVPRQLTRMMLALPMFVGKQSMWFNHRVFFFFLFVLLWCSFLSTTRARSRSDGTPVLTSGEEDLGQGIRTPVQDQQPRSRPIVH